MVRPQADNYEQRRDVIIEKAAELFAEIGFNGTSVGDLADACAMSKSLFYHYYNSKEDVLHEVVSLHIDLLSEEASSILAEDENSIGCLRKLVHRFLQHYVGGASRQKVMLNELGNLPADKRQVIVEKQRNLIEVVQVLLADIHPVLAVDPVRARVETLLLFGMINGTHTWFDPSGPMSVDDVAEMVLDRFEFRNLERNHVGNSR